MESRQNTRRTLVPGLAGLLLLILYFVVTTRQHWFQLNDFNYLGDLAASLYRLPLPQAVSMLSKITLVLPAACLLAWALTMGGFEIRKPQFVEHEKFPLLLSVISVVILSGLVLFVFRATELTDDELAYVFQAKTYLAGRLFNPAPPVLHSFSNVFLINDGIKLVGKYQFGHPLLLAVGLLFGSEYIATFFMAAALFVLMAAISRDLFEDRRVAILSTLLLFVSPFFYLVSSSRLSHISSAFLLGIFFLLFLRIPKMTVKPSVQYVLSLLAGIAAGLAANMRPMTALAFLFPFLVILGWRLWKKEIERPLNVVCMATGFLAVIALTLAYNKLITGAFMTHTLMYYDPEDVLGFSVHSHSLALGLQNFVFNAIRMNAFLFGFPISLGFVFVVLLKSRFELGEKIAFSIIACFAVGYLLPWGPGVNDLGPIYYYECIIPLILLSARGFLWLHDSWKSRHPGLRSLPSNFLFVSVVLCFATFFPERLMHVSRLAGAIDAPYAVLEERHVHNAIVFMATTRKEGWVFGYKNNSPRIDNDVIACRLVDAESNGRVLENFKGRELYVFLWYGNPLTYDLRKVSPQELIGTNWKEELQKLRELHGSGPGG